MNSKRETIADDLLFKMMEVGKIEPSAMEDPYWKFNNPLTRAQYSKFKEEGVFLIQKALKINKRKAITAFNWWYRNFGVRLKG